MDVHPAWRALDRFEVRRRLARGRFGEVFEAVERGSGTRVALKTLPALAADRRAALLAEVTKTREIQHENIVRVLEANLDVDPPFLAMELVEGVDAVRFVRRPRPRPTHLRPTLPLAFGQPLQEGGLSAFDPATGEELARARTLVLGVARALAELHRRDRTHGDLHPANVLVTNEARVVVVDVVRAEEGWAGVPAYFAPETERGAPADVYSLGVILFEALTGALPFDGDAQTLLSRKRTLSAPRPSFVVDVADATLDDLCVRMLRRDPSERPTAEEIATSLRP